MLDQKNTVRNSIDRIIVWFWQTIFNPIINKNKNQKVASLRSSTAASESMLQRLSKPSKLKNVVLFCVGLQIISCTNIHTFSDYDALHTMIQNKQMLITLTDSTTIYGSEIIVADDSTTFRLKGVEGKTSIPTSSIYSLSKINRPKGAAQGFMATFLTLGTPFAIINYSDGDDGPDSFFRFTAEDKALLGAIFGAFLGLTLGVPFGALNGSIDLYVINPKPLKQDTSKSNETLNESKL